MARRRQTITPPLIESDEQNIPFRHDLPTLPRKNPASSLAPSAQDNEAF